ncbi:hypothetical protein ACIPR8_16380 [Stenotrophomonas sp. LARHCG68]|jgi:hypothetical protein
MERPGHAVAALALTAAFTAMPAAASNTCAATETPLFTCNTTNGKQVLLCDAGDTLHYTFGKPGRPPEMQLKVRREEASTWQWEGIGRAISYSINVPNGNTVYDVFWSVDRMTDEHEVQAGVNVEVNGRHVATVRCNADSVEQAMEGVDLKPAS